MSSSDYFVIFELAGAAYGIRSTDIHHVAMLEHIAAVPNAASAVDGVVFSRGQVVPAINLRTRFGLPRQEPTARTRLIFLQVRERTVALIVDAAREFRQIAASTIRPINETLVGIAGNYVEGVATVQDRHVLILDLGAVLTLEEITPPADAGDLTASARS